MGNDSAQTEVRLDKWLWAARLFKTRALAVQAIDAGQVRVNDAKVKPSRIVRSGDTILVTRPTAAIELVVRNLAKMRGPASVAVTLYEETPASILKRENAAREKRQPQPGARPTKRDRRQLDRFTDG